MNRSTSAIACWSWEVVRALSATLSTSTCPNRVSAPIPVSHHSKPKRYPSCTKRTPSEAYRRYFSITFSGCLHCPSGKKQPDASIQAVLPGNRMLFFQLVPRAGGMANLCANRLRILQQIQNRARLFDRLEQGLYALLARRRHQMNGVSDVVRINRNVLIPRLAAARVDLARHFHFERIDGHLLMRRLDEEDVRHAGTKHAQLQLGRTRSQVVTGEIRRAVADDLMIANTDTAHAAASFGADFGR